MTGSGTPPRVQAFERYARAGAFVAAAIGAACLIGWIGDIEVLKRIVPTFSAMKPNTAIGFVLAGTALWLTLRPTIANWIPASLSAIVVVIGGLTLFEYASGVDLGIDTLLFQDDPTTRTPGRMAPTTAASFVLLGTAVALLRTRVRTAHALAAIVSALSMVPMLGYLYGVEGLHTVSNYASVALPTAIAAFVVTTAVLSAFPLRGLTAPFANDTTAGVMMRRLLLTASAIPVVTGWLIVQGEDATWWESDFSSSLVVVVTVLLVGLILWRTAIVLFGIDQARSQAVDDLRQLNVELEERIEARTFELSESEARFRAVSESASDALITANEKGRIEYVNAAAARLFGYTSDELHGLPLTALMPRRFHAAHEAGIQRFVQTGVPKLVGQGSVELTGLRSDGTEIPIELSLSSWTSKGDTFVSGIIRDITERAAADRALRDSELFFRAIAENVGDLILRMDPQGRVTYASPASRTLLATAPEDMIGLTAMDFVPPEGAAEIQRVYGQVFNGESASTTQKARRPDGMEVWLEGIASPVMDEEAGVLRSIIWVIRDVTGHLKELEIQKETAHREQQLNQLKNEFVGIVAHDLKSPMTVIGGFADILLSGWEDIPDSDKLEFLERIKDNIGRLSTLVDDVLQVSRIESGEISMEVGPVDLARLIRRTSEEVVTTFPQRRIEVDVPADLPIVLGDEDRQWRVLSNLLSNALKFSEGDAPVEVSARQRGDDVEVSVTDHGHGIRPEDVGKLFQRFSRVQQPAGKNVKGTGLGLYITRSLVEAQGGRISVESELGEGTTFRYTVPVLQMGGAS